MFVNIKGDKLEYFVSDKNLVNLLPIAHVIQKKGKSGYDSHNLENENSDYHIKVEDNTNQDQ